MVIDANAGHRKVEEPITPEFHVNTLGRRGVAQHVTVVKDRPSLIERLAVPLLLLTGGQILKSHSAQGLGGADTSTSQSAPPSEAAHTTFGSGMYRVGVDVEPGTYSGSGMDERSVYWERLLDASRDHTSRIANYFGQGPTYVTLDREGEYFYSEGCSVWTRVDHPAVRP